MLLDLFLGLCLLTDAVPSADLWYTIALLCKCDTSLRHCGDWELATES